MIETETSYNDNDYIVSKVHVYDLLGSLSGQGKIDLIETLSCEKEVTEHVADLIIQGCTQRGSYPCLEELDSLTERVLSELDEVYASQIERLRRLVTASEERLTKSEKEVSVLRNRFDYWGGIGD